MLAALKDIYRILNTDVGELLNHQARHTAAQSAEDEKKAVAHRYYQEILNEARLDVIDELMTPDFVFTIPTHPDPYHGPDGFKELVTMLHGAFPDVHLEVQHLLVDGDTVVGHWKGSGTHSGGPLHTVKGDIPASGKHFVIDGVSWLKIVDGKVVESLANEDTLSLLQQIGVIPSPPPPSSENCKEVARRFFTDLMSGGQMEAIADIIAPEFVLHLPLLPQPIHGQAGLQRFLSKFHSAFSEIQYSFEREMVDNGMAAIRWVMSAQHTGDFQGFAATGKTVRLQGVSIFRLVDCQVAEVWVNENDLGLIEQLQPAPVEA